MAPPGACASPQTAAGSGASLWAGEAASLRPQHKCGAFKGASSCLKREISPPIFAFVESDAGRDPCRWDTLCVLARVEVSPVCVSPLASARVYIEAHVSFFNQN